MIIRNDPGTRPILTALARVWFVALAATAIASPVHAASSKCPPDSVRVGDSCVDTYEASVWRLPEPVNQGLVKKISKGKVSLQDLTDAGATQRGCTAPPFYFQPYPSHFPADGNWTPVGGTGPPTPAVYAVSIAGVLPTTCTSQLQAAQACALSGKHLITNAEWQRAAAGTPDPGNLDDGTTTCVTTGGGPASTGSRAACVSAWGVHDMVGNVWELVSDWADFAHDGTTWSASAGITDGDVSFFGGDASDAFHRLPGATIRGGQWSSSQSAGVLAVTTAAYPSQQFLPVGFRCAR